jgi:hypothetical protein
MCKERLRSLVLLLFLTLCSMPAAFSQECTNQFNRAVWHPDQALISANLMHPLRPAEQTQAEWLLLDSTGNVTVSIAPVTIQNYGDPDHPEAPPRATSTSVYVRPMQPLMINHTYYFRARNILTAGCRKIQAEVAPTVVLTDRKTPPAFAVSPSTSRDDSDFYLAPTIDGASGSKASYTLDGKFQYRRAWIAPQFGTNTTYRPGISFTPGMSVKISSNPKEDGDSVNIRAPLEVLSIVDPISLPNLAKILPAVISRPGFVVEADKKFHDVNAIFSDGEYFVLHGLDYGPMQIVTEPMVGLETGSNLKAQTAGTYPSAILRADLGFRVVATIFQPSKGKPLFSLESNYIRRLLLNPEPTYTQDSKGNLVLLSVGTQPRDHVDLKISYNLAPLVALSVGYEYGELPPVYTKVDNKYTFGVTFKGQLQAKPKNTD